MARWGTTTRIVEQPHNDTNSIKEICDLNFDDDNIEESIKIAKNINF